MGRYINTVLGERWTDDPQDEPTNLRYSRGCVQALGRISSKVDMLVEEVAKLAPPPFTPAVVDEVGRMLVEGRIKLPSHARLTVTTTVEKVRHKLFNTTTDVMTHEADQLHTKLLRPFTILECLEAGLIRRMPNGWTWSEVAYERLAKGA
jgi:hypothetical protein